MISSIGLSRVSDKRLTVRSGQAAARLALETLESRTLLTVDATVGATSASLPESDQGAATVMETSNLTPALNVETILPGDANQDGAFDQQDIAQVLSAGKYLSGQSANWSEGDWNNDRRFDQYDLVLALQQGHYSETAGGAA